MTSLGEKLVAKLGATDVACFVPPYMADAYRAQTAWPVNDPASLAGDDLLLVAGNVRAEAFDVRAGRAQPRQVRRRRRLPGAPASPRPTSASSNTDSIDALLESAKTACRPCDCEVPVWKYTWDLVLANPGQLTKDFAAAGRSGIEGTVEAAQRHPRQPRATSSSARARWSIRWSCSTPSTGRSTSTRASRSIPFTRIEGPCYVGKKSILLGAKCREGMSIGPMCRVGGEVEESIIQGYSNKYHDGFLGHAYVGEWVNLGALTTNSDLKNDYSSVSVTLDGQHAHRHRLDQGRLADRRPHEDLDRHAVQHGRLRRRDGPDRGHRQAAAEVHPVASPGSSRAW